MKKPSVSKPVAASAAVVKPGLPAKPLSKAQALAPIMPAKPGKPAAPSKPAAPAAPTAPTAPSKAPIVDNTAALRAELDAAKAQLAKLLAKAEKLNAKIRTRAQILDGAPTLPAGDWRTEYAAADIAIHACVGHPGSYEPEEGGGIVAALLAIPRDTDLGGDGSKARLNGLLAVHWETTETGDYCGGPLYVTRDDLARIWAS